MCSSDHTVVVMRGVADINEPRLSFNVLFKREDDMWIAHYLELNVVTTTSTESEALQDLNDLIVAQLRYALADASASFGMLDLNQGHRSR